jgi:hypothetical protein
MALAGGEGDIGNVERNSLADAQPRVERHQRQYAVAASLNAWWTIESYVHEEYRTACRLA